MRARLRSDLGAALKTRSVGTAQVLRTIMAAIDNAEAVDIEQGPYRERAFGDPAAEVPRKSLSDADVLAILVSDAAERDAAATELEASGRPDRAAELRAEAALVRTYVPR